MDRDQYVAELTLNGHSSEGGRVFSLDLTRLACVLFVVAGHMWLFGGLGVHITMRDPYYGGVASEMWPNVLGISCNPGVWVMVAFSVVSGCSLGIAHPTAECWRSVWTRSARKNLVPVLIWTAVSSMRRLVTTFFLDWKWFEVQLQAWWWLEVAWYIYLLVILQAAYPLLVRMRTMRGSLVAPTMLIGALLAFGTGHILAATTPIPAVGTVSCALLVPSFVAGIALSRKDLTRTPSGHTARLQQYSWTLYIVQMSAIDYMSPWHPAPWCWLQWVLVPLALLLLTLVAHKVIRRS